MKTAGLGHRICPCCMEDHEIQTVIVDEMNIFKDVSVEYKAEYNYCSKTDEMYADEQQVSANDIAMKNAYRAAVGLLTSDQIAAIRLRYGISQGDLCLLLGWGAKTITRYESHQVQDIAHDTILRKISTDPEWFLDLLRPAKDSLSPASYEKYLETGTTLFEQGHDIYLTSAIMAKYARFRQNPDYTGNVTLSLDIVTDMIRYYANASGMIDLYLAKLTKMLWYADALSYKRRGYALSGMAYLANPSGVVPVAFESIIDLNTIHYEETDISNAVEYRFTPASVKEYPCLSPEDTAIMDVVIDRFGRGSKSEIAESICREKAYLETLPNDVIRFRYASALSLS